MKHLIKSAFYSFLTLLCLTLSCAKTSTVPSEQNGKEVNGTFIIGNGADGIECESSYNLLANDSFGFLDFYELQKQNLKVRAFEESNPFSIAKRVIDEIKKLDKVRHEIYSQYLDEFESETLFLTNAHLPDIPDNGPLELPGEDCKLVQIVQQLPEKLMLSHKGGTSGQGRYNIDNHYWKKLSRVQKAGVIIHEIVYREVLEYGIQTSPRIRRFTGFLFSDEILAADHESYSKIIDEIRFPGVLKVDGHIFRTKQSEYAENGYLKTGYLANVDNEEDSTKKIEIFGLSLIHI